MPIQQTGTGPGIASLPKAYDFGDPYAQASSVLRASKLPPLSDVIEGGYAPGTLAGGFSYQSVKSMGDVRLTSDFLPNEAPLTVSPSLLAHPFGTGVKTGSFQINALDMSGTLAHLTGDAIGRDSPLFGSDSGSQDPLTLALDMANNYMTMPTKLLDKLVAVPVTWLAHALGQANQPGLPKNPDGSDWYSFHADPRYWAVILNGSDAQIEQMAQMTAAAQVAPSLQKAYADQLLAVFHADKNAATGLSSGNDRIDYLAKSNLAFVAEMAKVGVGGGGVTLQDLADPSKFGTLVGGAFASASRSLMTFVPFVGTDIAKLLEPVSPETERLWAAVPADIRRAGYNVASLQSMIADIGASWPLFSGAGTFLAAAKSGTLGAQFVESGAMARILRVADSYAMSFGAPTLATDRIAAATRVADVISNAGSKLYTAYDYSLYAMRMSLAGGLALASANWALEAISPEYARTAGREIDASHFISDSSLAAGLNMMGLFSGGTFGATTLFRMTRGAVSEVAGRAGMGAGPFNGLQDQFLGSFGQLRETASALGHDPMTFDQSFKNLTESVIRNTVRDMHLDAVARLPDEVQQIARLQSYEATAPALVDRLAKALKVASSENKLWGWETPKTTEARLASSRAAREFVDGMTKKLVTERRTHWAQELRKLDQAYTPEGFSTYIAKVADSMGWKYDAKALESANGGNLSRWEQSANAVEMRAFDIHNGVLKSIVDSGTSESAADLTITRVGDTDALLADRFVQQFDALEAANAAPEAKAQGLSYLRGQLIDTFTVRAAWAKMNPAEEGARTLESMSDRQLYNILKQIRPVLGHARELPDRATVQPADTLNQLAVDLADQGIWQLSYKPTETTAVGVAKAQWEAAMKQAYEAPMLREESHAAARDAMNEAGRIADQYRRDLEDQLYTRFIKPVEDGPLAQQQMAAGGKVNDLEFEAIQRQGALTKDPAVVAAYRAWMDAEHAFNTASLATRDAKSDVLIAAKATYDSLVALPEALSKELDAARALHRKLTEQYMKAYDKASAQRSKAMLKDQRMLELDGNAERARLDYMNWEANNPVPLVERVGPVAPEGFVFHPSTLVDALEAKGDFQSQRLAQFIRDHVDDIGPGGPGFWHATTHMDMIARGEKPVGLRSAEELKASGLPGLGTGGGARETESSTTVSYEHALAWESRFKEMARIVNGEHGLSDVFDYWVSEYPHLFNEPANIAEKLSYTLSNALDDFLLKSGEAPDSAAAWDFLYTEIMRRPSVVGVGAYDAAAMLPSEIEGRVAARVLQKVDEALPEEHGARVVITGDPWAKFKGTLKEENVGIARVAVKPDDAAHIHIGVDEWGGEVALNTTHTFVYKEIPGQPFDAPVPDVTSYWNSQGPLERPVSYVRLYNPETGQASYLASDFIDHPTNADTVGLSNRGYMAHKYDELFRGWRSWKLNEAIRAQASRILIDRYDVLPEQVDNFIGQAMNMAYEKWSPLGEGRHFATALGPQAVAILRARDVEAVAGRIFGQEPTGRFDAAGHPIMRPAQYVNRATGRLETPDWAHLLADGFKQGWSLNFTAGITSRLKTFGAPGIAASLFGDWLIPNLRYAASAVFKGSELVESKQFNAMRGAPRTTPELRALFAKYGMNTQHGTLAEVGTDEMLRALSNSLLPRPDEIGVSHPNGLGSLETGPEALAQNFLDLAKQKAADPSLSAKARQAWKTLVDPTPFKDGLANDLAIKYLADDFAPMLRRFEPQAYNVLRRELKVPDNRMAEFIAEDRSLYQRWQDGEITMQDLMDHTAKFNAGQLEQLTPKLEAFYASPEYAALEGMLRIGAKTAQTEAFGVHYFGSYRSSFERSLNHPVLGVYPASWAIKAGKEWFQFLFENKTFGGGALHLGAAPAAFLQQVVHQQAQWFAQNNDMTLDDWMFKNPLSRWFFMFNLLLPGDWSNMPFPASRSIRDLLRGQTNPVQIFSDNMVGPQSRGGLGVIRDFNLARLGIMDTIDALTTHHQDTPWDKLILGLNSAGNAPTPPDFNKITSYQRRTLTAP